jgi:hypothetical protein
MTIQSLYCAPSVNDIVVLVKEQATPELFFKVFLELNLKNMFSYLSFD